ncbi:hypothetical protein DBR06_SOUSAS18110040, partial [Sousa chinensis]
LFQRWRIHAGEEPYECSRRGKDAFSEGYSLVWHQKVHS